MNLRTTADRLVEKSTEPASFQEAEPFTGVRQHDPSAQQAESPPAELAASSPWKLRVEPEVMTSLLNALISGS